jgi:hypothetical protein
MYVYSKIFLIIKFQVIHFMVQIYIQNSENAYFAPFFLKINYNKKIKSFTYNIKLKKISVTVKFSEWFYYKHTCILRAYWEVSPSKYWPWAAMHLVQRCCLCWKHFWNSCCGIAFSDVVTCFGCLQYYEISVPLRPFLFLETGRSHSEPNEGNRLSVLFQ